MIAVLLFAFLSLACSIAPLYSDATAQLISGRYIIVYKDDVDSTTFAEELESNYDVIHKYQYAFKGFAATLNKDELTELRAHPLVSYIEVDQMMSINACVSTPSKSWGLTRISQTTPDYVDMRYSYPESAGEGVTAYIIDTGVYVEHNDFEGRASFGFKAESNWSDKDMNGHGTHVASTVAGITYGVAKKASIVAVKVLGDNGSGTNTGVIAGVEYAIANGKDKTSVINMSLGGGFSSALNSAVNSAVANNIFVAVAAGNDNQDASRSSPASAKDVICVGSTEEGVRSDDRSYFSNYGAVVDVFAPGSGITAAWIGSPSATNTISGTSMASPHVAGIGALIMADFELNAEEVGQKIVADSWSGQIKLDCEIFNNACSKTANKMVNNGCTTN